MLILYQEGWLFPLLSVDEIISLEVGELDEKKGKINVLEELFFRMLVVTIARVTNEWLVLIGG